MAKSTQNPTDKLWTSDVAAVASLLLGLLLVVAILAVSITQIGSVHESFYQAVDNLRRPANVLPNPPLVAGMSDEIIPRDSPPSLASQAGGASNHLH